MKQIERALIDVSQPAEKPPEKLRAHFFTTHSDTAGEAWSGSLSELIEEVRAKLKTTCQGSRDPDGKLNRRAKGTLPCWGAYELRGPRSAANVVATYGEQIDLDTLSDEQFADVRRLPLRGFGHTTPSDPLPNGVRCARLFVFYDRPVTPDERARARAALCNLLSGTLGIEIDRTTHNADRLAYAGRAASEPEREFWELTGDLVNVDGLLKAAADLPIKSPAPAAATPAEPAPPSDDYGPDAAALAALLRPHFPKGRRNEIRLRGAGALRHAGWPQGAAERLFVDELAPEDGDVSKARAAVANSYSTPTPTGWPRFAELVPDRSVTEAMRAIACRRSDEADRAFAEGIEQRHAKPAEPATPFLDVFAPLPDVPWVVAGLDLAPGAPTIVAGFGFSGKTVSLQAMLLAIAAGAPVWRSLAGPGEPRTVLHLDFEQGGHLTAKRYQRLARGLSIAPDSVRERLHVLIAPNTLDKNGAEEWLVQISAGHAIVVIDSFRAAWPSLDENASESRAALDMLFRVSERTAATFIVVHHAGKGSDQKGKRERLRGSSALFDACQSVLLFEPTKDEPGAPVRVTQAKARLSGRPAKPFELLISDVPRDTDPQWGLSVGVGNAVQRDEIAELESEILAALTAEPGSSLNRLKLRIKRRSADVSDALHDLSERGLVYYQESADAAGKRKGWYPVRPHLG